jgi:hypothetical protein
MKRFSNLFVYESTNFHGVYKNCKLLEDVPYHGPSSRINDPFSHTYAFAGEVFPTVIVDLEASEIRFFEEFEDQNPVFTIHFKVSYL